MMGRVSVLLVIVVILIVIYIFKPLYTVDETEQAVVLEWGVNPVKVVKEAGLHFKWPWPFQSILKFDERLLEYDAHPREIITKDKKTLILDNYARWRINDQIDIIAEQRESIMQKVTERCNAKAKEYGIEIADVRIKSAELPKENEQSVFQRMIAERERQAKKYR